MAKNITTTDNDSAAITLGFAVVSHQRAEQRRTNVLMARRAVKEIRDGDREHGMYLLTLLGRLRRAVV